MLELENSAHACGRVRDLRLSYSSMYFRSERHDHRQEGRDRWEANMHFFSDSVRSLDAHTPEIKHSVDQTIGRGVMYNDDLIAPLLLTSTMNAIRRRRPHPCRWVKNRTGIKLRSLPRWFDTTHIIYFLPPELHYIDPAV